VPSRSNSTAAGQSSLPTGQWYRPCGVVVFHVHGGATALGGTRRREPQLGGTLSDWPTTWARVAAHRGVLLLCGAYLAALLLLRPASPFEWDEVQYQRALDHYDVAAHSPHPPGAPVYVATASALRLLVRDPLLALQLVTAASALAALALLYALVLRLGGSRQEALLASCVLALIPGFAFHANIGMTDVPATAGVLAVLLAALAAIDDPRRLIVLAAVTSVALGIRPQALPAVALVGAWAIAGAVRRRAFKELLSAIVCGVVLTAAIWIPPILLTGVARYRQAVVDHARWMATADVALRLPAASLRSIARYWLVNQLGSRELAAAFWLAVLGGTTSLWRAGRRRAVAVALLSAIPYIALGLFTFNMLAAVRFTLPAMALAAAVAAGLVTASRPRLRVAALVLLGVWGVAVVAWGLPAYVLRRQPAPVWSGLIWVKEHLDPQRTLLVTDGSTRPHLEYLLGGAGFRTQEWVPGAIYPRRLPSGEDVVLLTARSAPGWEVLRASDWQSRRLVQLAFWRYGSFAVQRPHDAAGAQFSPSWGVEGDHYLLSGTGQIQLTRASGPMTATLCPQRGPLRVVSAGAPPTTVADGACLSFPLRPGRRGGLFATAPEHTAVELRPVAFAKTPDGGSATAPSGAPQPEFDALAAAAQTAFPLAGAGGSPDRAGAAGAPSEGATLPQAPAMVLLPAARIDGHDSARWRTELVIENRSPSTARVTVELLLAGEDNAAPPAKELTIEAGGRFVSEDAVGELFAADGAGALRVQSGGGPVQARLRTYDAARKAPRGHFLDAVPETAGFGPGRAALLRNLANDPDPDTRKRTNVGLLNLGAVAIEVEIALRDESGKPLGKKALWLRPREFRQVNDIFSELDADRSPGGSAEVTTATPGGSLLAYAAVVRKQPAGVTYVTP
jgi:hypothetical protein